VRLNLLGTFEARHHDVAVAVGRRQERCLLGVLALDAGRPVSIDRLMDLLWEANPPASARAAVHTYVARLRRRLSPHGVQILTCHDGYQVPTGDVQVDAHEFADLIASADRSVGAAGRAAGYRQALDLWRGDLMSDVAGDGLRHRMSSRLLELRWQAIEGRMEALLELDQAAAVITEFAEELAANPGRERMVGHGITACYRMNRQADALALYESTRAYLAEELGVDPGPELRTLHTGVLRQSPGLATTAREDGTPPSRDDDPEQGWYVRRLSALLRLDGPTPVTTVSRTIVALRNGLKTIAVRFSVPRPDPGLHSERNLLVDVLQGARLVSTERVSQAHYRFVLDLPRPLRRSESHTFSMMISFPDGQPMRTHYALVPLASIESFDVRIRFDPANLPAIAWRFERLAPQTLNEQLTPGMPLPIDDVGEVAQFFDHLQSGFGYGIAWRGSP
jgi:DNA-binding SARP family transcriptional activator